MKSYYWLPRPDENAETGDSYQHVPIGGAYFYTDLRTLLPSGHGQGNFYYNWHLPADFPRKVALVGVHAEFGYQNPVVQQVPWSIYIDVAGRGYKTGTPPGAETGSNFSNDIYLAGDGIVTDPNIVQYTWNHGQPFFFPPVIFDRDAGDHLVYDIANNVMLDWIAAKIYWNEV